MNRNVIALLLVLGFLGYSYDASSQVLAEGYYVKSSGDTIRGFIREHVDYFQPYLDFAQTPESDLVRIYLINVKGFYLKKYNDYYYSRVVEIDKKPVEVNQLDNFPGRRIITDTVALHLLIRGAIDLFEYTDENSKQHFFVSKNGADPEELAYVRYASSGGRIAEMPYFIEPFKRMLSDCDKVNKNAIEYSKKAFIKVITQYNSCFTKGDEYEVQKTKNKVAVIVFFGAGNATVGYKGNTDVSGTFHKVDASGADFTSSPALSGGIRFDFLPKSEAGRLIPGFDVAFLKTGTSEASVKYGSSSLDQLKMDFTFVNLSLSVRYFIVKNSPFKVYLNAGSGGGYVVGSTSTFVNYDYTLQATSRPASFSTYRKYSYRYFGGAGFAYQRVSLELTYGKNIAFSKTRDANGFVNGVYATLGYRISK